MALEFLRLLREQGQVDVISYSSAMSACEKGRQGHRALALLAELMDGRLEVDAICLNAAMSACEKSGLWRMAIHLADGGSNPAISAMSRLAPHGRGRVATRSYRCVDHGRQPLRTEPTGCRERLD